MIKKIMEANPIPLTLNLVIYTKRTVNPSCLKIHMDPMTKGRLCSLNGDKKLSLNVFRLPLKSQHQEPLKLKNRRKGRLRKTRRRNPTVGTHIGIHQEMIQTRSGRNQWLPRDMDLPTTRLRVKLTTATICTDKTTATSASICLNLSCLTCQQPVFQEDQCVLLIHLEAITLLNSWRNRDMLRSLITK